MQDPELSGDALNRLQMHVLTGMVILYTGLGERIFVSAATGGRGVLPVLPLLLPAVVFCVLLLPSFGRPLAILANRELWLYWGPYLVLTYFLTLAAIVFNDYPVRTGFDVVRLIVVPLSILLVGGAVGSAASGRRLIAAWVFWFLLLEAGYAIVVQVARLGLVRIPWLDPILAWDLATQVAYADYYQLVGRAIGTYINPNMLGFLAALGFWFFWFHSHGARRTLSMTLMAVLVVATTSRGALIALAGSTGLIVGREMAIAYRDARVRKEVVLVPAALLGLAVLTLVVIYQNPQGRFAIERFGEIFAIVSRGAEASSSVANRLEALELAFSTMTRYPFGTLGSPELTLQSFIDNEFVRVTLQGGVAYLLCYLFALWGGLRNLLEVNPWRAYLAAASAVVAFMALTAQPLTYVVAGLYWLTVGTALATRPSPSRPATEKAAACAS